MLFKFGTFWRLLLGSSLSWVCWTMLGFEFTIVTMLSILIVILTRDKHFLV